MNTVEQTQQTEMWIRRYLDAIDGHDLAAADALVADDIEFHDCHYPPMRGKAEITEWAIGLWEGMPDSSRDRTVNLTVTGRIAIGEFEFSGTHTGTYLGYPATGKRVFWQSVIVYEFNEAGQLARQMYYNDAGALEAQLAGGAP
jgi:steroid delta-isomerase-like uncharacterized protein